MITLLAATVISLGLSAPPPGVLVPHLSVRMVDFTASTTHSDHTQFYLNQSQQTQSGGEGYFPPHEYDTSQALQTVGTVVYAHGSSIAVQVKFYNPLSYQVSGTWSCDAVTFTRTSCSPPQGYTITKDQQGDTSITIPGYGTATETVYLSGFPNFVCKGDISIDFSADCGITGDGGYSGVLYFTDVTPAGHMDQPWTEVLDKSCTWADGQSGKSGCLEKVTRGLFNSGLFYYSGSRCYHIVDTLYDEEEDPDDNGIFDLSYLVTHGSGQSADCRDTSSFLLLCTSSLGYSAGLTQLYYTTPTFHTNDKMAIGVGPTGSSSSNFTPIDWNYHQVLDDSGYVYDACLALKLDLSGNDFRDVPTGWVKADYWQKQVGGSYYGLVVSRTGHSPEAVTKSEISAQLNGPFSGGVALLQGIR